MLSNENPGHLAGLLTIYAQAATCLLVHETIELFRALESRAQTGQGLQHKQENVKFTNNHLDQPVTDHHADLPCHSTVPNHKAQISQMNCP